MTLQEKNMQRNLPCLSPEAQSIRADSFYEHYKGPRYRVLSVARHSENLEEHVVYQDQEGNVWVRPLAMFLENITVNGQTQARFKPVK
ncbi:MAG: DUF1653 domain-containing protein [Parachlamydia sp.]|nr:DUF1653 domain-containing protein [Parachlamydia sp.]